MEKVKILKPVGGGDWWGEGLMRMSLKWQNIDIAPKVENMVALRLFHALQVGISDKIASISRPECDLEKGFLRGRNPPGLT